MNAGGGLGRLLAELKRRGLVEGGRSSFGQPLVLPEMGRAPQALAESNPQQTNVVTFAYATPWPGPDLCAAWVENVVAGAGFGYYPGNADDLYERHCGLEDVRELKVGMIVAVPLLPVPGSRPDHGHVGVYVGDGLVRDSAERGLRTVPLDLWLLNYCLRSRPRWGWLGGVALA